MTTGTNIASNLHACQIISGRDIERVAKQIDAALSAALARSEGGLRQIEDIAGAHVSNPGLDLNVVEVVKKMADKLARSERELAEAKEHHQRDEAMIVQRTDEVRDLTSRLATAEAERKKLFGYYDEIVKAIGHDCILKEYNQRGELLRQEAHWRKEAETQLATTQQQLAATQAELAKVHLQFEAACLHADQLSAELSEAKATHGATVKEFAELMREMNAQLVANQLRAAARPDAGKETK